MCLVRDVLFFFAHHKAAHAFRANVYREEVLKLGEQITQQTLTNL